MKYLLPLYILLLAVVPLHAQQLQFNAPAPLAHGKRCDIQSSPGIIGDRYYILYNDYTRKKGPGDRMDTYLKIYSVEKGDALRSVNLNALVSGARKDGHILFANVLLWKDRLLGLYMSWEPLGMRLHLYARLLDEKGNVVGSPLLVETVSPAPVGKSKVATINEVTAKNARELAEGLHYAFNDDSSGIALYYAGNAWRGFEPVLIGAGLRYLKKWKMDLDKRETLLQCVPRGEDTLFALVKRAPGTGKEPAGYGLYAFSFGSGRTSGLMPVSLPGKHIQGAGFRFNSQGDMIVTGTYTLPGKTPRFNSTYGVFGLKLDTRGEVLHTDIQPFPDGMISDLAGYKAASRGKGLGRIVPVSRIIPLQGTGMATVGRSFRQGSEVTASPVILSPHYDADGYVILTGIGPGGKVKWISYLRRFYEDIHSGSMPAPFYATRDRYNHLLVIYDENGEKRSRQQIHIDRYGDQGIRDRDWLALPRSFNTLSTWILWNTACNVDHNTVMVAYYNPWKKQMGTLRIGLSEETRVAANP